MHSPEKAGKDPQVKGYKVFPGISDLAQRDKVT